MNDQWDDPLVPFGQHYRIDLAHGEQQVIKRNGNKDGDDDNLDDHQIDIRIPKIMLPEKKKNQDRIDRYE